MADQVGSLGIIDWVLLAVILVSTLISIKRGFVKEALSLVTLVAAMVISRMFGAEVSTLLVDVIEVPSIRSAAAYLGLFFSTLIVGGLINSLIVSVVHMAGLGGLDRTLGMIFGFSRGVLILVVIVAVCARIGLSEDNWWQESVLLPQFVALGDWLQMTGWENASKLFDTVESPNSA